ncbi:hypothetical protein GCM10025780_30510 [Frondihabitans cladoniiphilus]|uniref:Uncharacterized protein n=1 Tax=Frondihabitans cladoniiphilus TaxID=715785 RepID=A0ABP8W7Y8_9MICO
MLALAVLTVVVLRVTRPIWAQAGFDAVGMSKQPLVQSSVGVFLAVMLLLPLMVLPVGALSLVTVEAEILTVRTVLGRRRLGHPAWFKGSVVMAGSELSGNDIHFVLLANSWTRWAIVSAGLWSDAGFLYALGTRSSDQIRFTNRGRWASEWAAFRRKAFGYLVLFGWIAIGCALALVVFVIVTS